MAIEAHKRQNESVNSVVYRFTRKMKQSGVLTEMKKRRFHGRAVNRNKRRQSAIYRKQKHVTMERERKLGIV